jgi:hypothetical protein
MLHAGGVLDASIFVGEKKLGKVILSNKSEGSGLCIIMDVMTVPWGELKIMGRLRFRMESSAVPASPSTTPPTPATSSPTVDAHASSQFDAALRLCVPRSGAARAGDLSDLSKPQTTPKSVEGDREEIASPLYMSSTPSSVGPGTLGPGVALYMNSSQAKPASPVSCEATAARWGLFVDVSSTNGEPGKGEQSGLAKSRHSPHREEVLAYVAALEQRVKDELEKDRSQVEKNKPDEHGRTRNVSDSGISGLKTRDSPFSARRRQRESKKERRVHGARGRESEEVHETEGTLKERELQWKQSLREMEPGARASSWRVDRVEPGCRDEKNPNPAFQVCTSHRLRVGDACLCIR